MKKAKIKAVKNLTPQLDRLANPRRYADELNTSDLKGLLTAISKMTMKEIAEKIKDENLTGSEVKALTTFIRTTQHKSKDHLNFVKYVDDRVYGKLSEVIEHTGQKDAAPIQVNITDTTKEAMKRMTTEELMNLRKISSSIINKNKA